MLGHLAPIETGGIAPYLWTHKTYILITLIKNKLAPGELGASEGKFEAATWGKQVSEGGLGLGENDSVYIGGKIDGLLAGRIWLCAGNVRAKLYQSINRVVPIIPALRAKLAAQTLVQQ
jgi:hypothetical protein